MLRKYNEQRTIGDNLKLGVLSAFAAGMTNVAALVLFFSFASNITGHFAILASEIANGKWYQVAVVFLWVFLFLLGSFISNLFVIHGDKRRRLLNHALPLTMEILCLVGVGYYGHFHYTETLMETELLVALLLFAMGLQNGLTASISNFAVKTTHLTGLTTDLAIHLSMATKKFWREKPEVRQKLVLLTSIAVAYIAGGIVAGSITSHFQYKVFFFIASLLSGVLLYDVVRNGLSVRSQPSGARRALRTRTTRSEGPEAGQRLPIPRMAPELSSAS
ncbi:MAG: DUF1275 domain-containing protein [Flavobacteriales bacterium]|nr:DUF1275 domain-containing protein [Flavobacteriales bacterium]